MSGKDGVSTPIALLSSGASLDRKMIVELMERSGGRAAIFWYRSAHQGKSSDGLAGGSLAGRLIK